MHAVYFEVKTLQRALHQFITSAQPRVWTIGHACRPTPTLSTLCLRSKQFRTAGNYDKTKYVCWIPLQTYGDTRCIDKTLHSREVAVVNGALGTPDHRSTLRLVHCTRKSGRSYSRRITDRTQIWWGVLDIFGAQVVINGDFQSPCEATDLMLARISH